MKESTIQQQIIEYLSIVAQRHNIIYFAPLNESAMMILKMFKVPETTCYKIISFLKKMGMIAGIPDLWIGFEGKAFFIEVKKPGGKASATQKLIHKALKRCGFETFVLDNIEDAKKIIDGIIEV